MTSYFSIERFRRLFGSIKDVDEYGNIKQEYIDNVVKNVFLKYNCIFIHIPKTAGISICKALFGIDSVGHYTLDDYKNTLTKEFIDSSFKFAFVRCPYSRLYSAYRYLYSGGRNHINDRKYMAVISKYGDFESFVLNYISSQDEKLILHFRPQFQFINCDSISLDFIGKVECLKSEFEFVQGKLGMKNKALTFSNASGKDFNIHDIYSSKMIDVVRRVYRVDFDSFGYKM